MASISDIETTNPGSMWELDQDLDVPMDEEASRLKNMWNTSSESEDEYSEGWGHGAQGAGDGVVEQATDCDAWIDTMDKDQGHQHAPVANRAANRGPNDGNQDLGDRLGHLRCGCVISMHGIM